MPRPKYRGVFTLVELHEIVCVNERKKKFLIEMLFRFTLIF